MTSRLIKIFLCAAGILVLAAAAERLACLFHDTLTAHRLLLSKDKFSGLTVRDGLWLIFIAELLLGVALLFLKNNLIRLCLLAWATTNYFLIKAAYLFEHIPLKHTSIGRLSDPFHLAQWWPEKVSALVAYYLLAGAYLALAWLGWQHWREMRRNQVVVQTGRDGFWKMSCPECGGHVKFALTNEGNKIPCPHCAKPMKLRRDDSLKMSCFFCQGHIAFPAHALGTKMPCPHCHNDITLKEL